MTLNILLIVSFLSLLSSVRGRWDINLHNRNPAFSPQFYEDVLDPELCEKQLEYIENNIELGTEFFDASARIPRGFMQGNLVDLGDYYQCLGINHRAGDLQIEGKYCSILIDLENIETLDGTSNENGLLVTGNMKKTMIEYEITRAQMLAINGDSSELSRFQFPEFLSPTIRLGVCVPKACTSHRAMSIHPLANTTLLDDGFIEDFCRLPNDKPWVPVDYVAMVVLWVVGIVTAASTSYDVTCKVFLKKDPKEMNVTYQTFSVFTNAGRLLVFRSGDARLHCLDGIRVLAMMWVVLGQTFYSQMMVSNPQDLMDWYKSLKSVWVTSASITGDTFLTLAGLLVVYKITRIKIDDNRRFKKLTLIPLSRHLYMLPLMAFGVLLVASVAHRISDGPMWTTVAANVDNCRVNWWITLLNLQALLNTKDMCLGVSWYIGIYITLLNLSLGVLYHIVSGNRRKAWIAMTSGLLVTLTVTVVISFVNNYVATNLPVEDLDMDKLMDYLIGYYYSPFTRAPPFFIGLIVGYLIHIHRERTAPLSWLIVSFLWVGAIVISTVVFLIPHFLIKEEYDSQVLRNFVNSFMRPAWGVAVGWLIYACVNGYAGPINWFLSLYMWKVPARLSYAVFLFHQPVISVIEGSRLAPVYFSPARCTFSFVGNFAMTLVVAFFVTLLIEAPFATLVQRLFHGKIEMAAIETTDENEDKISNSKEIVQEIDDQVLIHNDKGETSKGFVYDTSKV